MLLLIMLLFIFYVSKFFKVFYKIESCTFLIYDANE